jgi:UDP-2,3-diacylglucosamine pyrophosphatase LpxH
MPDDLISVYQHRATSGPERYYCDDQVRARIAGFSDGVAVFRTYATERPGTVVIYRHESLTTNPPFRACYDMKRDRPHPDWSEGTPVANAYTSQQPGTIPIYVHRATNPERCYIDTNERSQGGWGHGEVLCFAYPAPVVLPVVPGDGDAHRVVALSDIHIGNNTNTCWYQRSVHEPYLVAALEWVVRNAGAIRELILLGDLVDTWTYPPSVRPPSMAEIIAVNPDVLGSGGALARVVKAVPKVTFLLGNHDGTLTNGDITALQNAVGRIELVDAVRVLTGASGARTVFSHGHHWTMFNAPDAKSRWAPLPVGHFVTRAFSYMMARRLEKLQPAQTVADLPNMGYPTGFDPVPFVNSLVPDIRKRDPLEAIARPDLAAVLLNYFREVADMPEEQKIVLPSGQETTIADFRATYADLFTRWVAKEGSRLNAARAAIADLYGEYLAWFAQRLAIQQSADLVVLGHTHTTVGGLTISPISYYNSGFECASAPDARGKPPKPPKPFTFTVVDVETAAAEIMMVTPGSYEISPAPVPAMPSAIQSPAMDFSCYVRIVNEGPEPLTLTNKSAIDGYWAVPPPPKIPAGGRGDAWLQDNPGAAGSDGTFTYTRGATTLPFRVSCPTGLYSNTASGAGDNFLARSGSGDWGGRGRVPAGDRPLQVIFTIGGSEAARTRVVYRGQDDGHIYEFFIGQTGWELFDHTKHKSAPLAAGDPMGFQSRTARVVYRGKDDHIYELFIGRSGWELVDLTDLTKAKDGALAAGDPMGFHSGTARVVYRGKNSHIYEFFIGQSGGWELVDLTDSTKATDDALAAGAPMGFHSDTARVVYRGRDGHIYQFCIGAGGRWELFDHTKDKSKSAPLAAGDPMGFHSGTARVVYRGQDGHIYQFYPERGRWELFDHTKDSNAPSAAGDPMGFHSDTARVVYRGKDSHIYEFGLGQPHVRDHPSGAGQKAGWQLFDYTTDKDANAPLAAGDPMGFHSGTTRVVYRGQDNRIYELLWDNRWKLLNHTSENKAPLAAGDPMGFEASVTSPWTPTSALAHAVYAAGFLYDPDQDIIYSRMDPLQRKLGYAYGYDKAAFLISADFDCEPIFFDYGGKHWMIELWKGQYGLMTGCEVGVYTRPIGSKGPGYQLLDATIGKRDGDNAPSHNLFYDCAADADRLKLSMTLRRDGEKLFTRGPELHWWLTGFKWGVLSDPGQLSLDVAITLKDDAMCKAFRDGIRGRPYLNLKVDGTTVSFTFKQPYSPQPSKHPEVKDFNRAVVSAYRALGLPSNDPNDVVAEFLNVAGLAILHLAEHLGQVVCRLAVDVLKWAFSSIVQALGDAFKVAASVVAGWLSAVSQAFATWVDEIEKFLGLPLDYSCYVVIDNRKGASDLVLTGHTATEGTYVVGPPRWIAKGTVARLVLKDPKPTWNGSEGTVTYKYSDAKFNMKTVKFSYECPFGPDNKAASSPAADWACFAKSADPRNPWSTKVPTRNSPLFVGYVTGGGQPT